MVKGHSRRGLVLNHWYFEWEIFHEYIQTRFFERLCDDYNDFRELLAREDLEEAIPIKYSGSGEIGIGGLYNTITNWDVACTYANGLPMYFMDNQTANTRKPHPGVEGGHGTLFVGSKGWVRVSRASWKVSPTELYRRGKNPGNTRLEVSTDHVHNFDDCVLSRKKPVGDLHSAVRSDIICQLSDIAIREGRPITWDSKKERIMNDPKAAKRTRRKMRKPWTL